MTRRTWLIAGGLLALVIIVGFLLWPKAAEDIVPDAVATSDPGAVDELDPNLQQGPVDLYFPGEGGKLYAESRLIPVVTETRQQIHLVIDALLAGPESTSLRPPLSQGARLRQVYLMGGRQDASGAQESSPAKSVSRSLGGQTVVLDFETEGGLPPRTTGSQRERLMVYSLVNSALLNFEEGNGVLILWNGRQNVTFGGHLDIGRPLGPDPGLVARQEPPPYSPDEDYLPPLFDAPVESTEEGTTDADGSNGAEPSAVSEAT